MSDDEECGIDIQVWKDNIAEIAHMFLSRRERDQLGGDARLLTLAWSAKEAVYKWNGRRGADFIQHVPIDQMVESDNSGFYPPISREPFQIDMECFGTHVQPKGVIYKDFSLACLVQNRPFFDK
jgi:hypothetical protein